MASHNATTEVQMTRYVHPDVRDMMEEPTADGPVRLALVIEDGVETEVQERVDRIGCSIQRVLPSGVVLVEAPLDTLSKLCELPGLESISPEDTMEVLS